MKSTTSSLGTIQTDSLEFRTLSTMGNTTPAFATVSIGTLVFHNLPVVSIDYSTRTVKVLFEGFSEALEQTVPFIHVKSFTYNTHFPIA